MGGGVLCLRGKASNWINFSFKNNKHRVCILRTRPVRHFRIVVGKTVKASKMQGEKAGAEPDFGFHNPPPRIHIAYHFSWPQDRVPSKYALK